MKKYAAVTTPLKKITPHKLRSTYGTMLYHETQDIYLVADVLGHKDVNTTRKHYARCRKSMRASRQSASGCGRTISPSLPLCGAATPRSVVQSTAYGGASSTMLSSSSASGSALSPMMTREIGMRAYSICSA